MQCLPEPAEREVVCWQHSKLLFTHWKQTSFSSKVTWGQQHQIHHGTLVLRSQDPVKPNEVECSETLVVMFVWRGKKIKNPQTTQLTYEGARITSATPEALLGQCIPVAFLNVSLLLPTILHTQLFQYVTVEASWPSVLCAGEWVPCVSTPWVTCITYSWNPDLLASRLTVPERQVLKQNFCYLWNPTFFLHNCNMINMISMMITHSKNTTHQ